MNPKTMPYSTHEVETASGQVFQLQDCASTAVSSYAWKPTESELAVLFKTDDRVLYVYSGVSPTEVDALQSAPSKGSFIMRNIKPNHEFRKEVLK